MLLAKLTVKNQLTIPKAALDRIPRAEYFEVRAEGKQLHLTPVEIRPATRHRQRAANPWSPMVETVIQRFARAVRAAYGDRVRAILVYGSQARGTATAASDVDVVVVLDRVTHVWSEHRQIHQLAYDASYGSQCPITVSVTPIDAQQYALAASPFIQEVQAHGIEVSS